MAFFPRRKSPVPKKELPLDVRGIDLNLTAEEIVRIIRETRER